MKKEAKRSIELLPVLGIVGLLFVILYFVLANIKVDPGKEPQRRSEYYLFYKLYGRLGYKIGDHPFTTIPLHPGDMAVCFDYDGEQTVLNKGLQQWIERGGTLFVGGLKGKEDPFSSSPIKAAPTRSIIRRRPQAARAAKEPVLVRLNGRASIQYFTATADVERHHVLLDSEHGPLIYAMKRGKGRIIVLSDSRLLTNDYLRKENLAVFFNQLMRPAFKQRIYILRQDIANRQKAVPLLALLFTGKLVYLTLQLLWILLLFIVWQGKRLGEPQLVDPFARRTLSEHLKAVSQFYQKTNALSIVDEINSDYVRYKLWKKTGVQWKERGPSQDAERLRRRLGSNRSGVKLDQVIMGLKREPHITLSRLYQKEKVREAILKSLRK
jgi:hypothetical protein